MSDTPRTDAKRGFFDLDTAVDANFAEELERENNKLREALEASQSWLHPHSNADGLVARRKLNSEILEAISLNSRSSSSICGS